MVRLQRTTSSSSASAFNPIIVLIHDILEDRDKTWSITNDGDYPDNVESNIWLKNLSTVFPQAEVLTYGYRLDRKEKVSDLLDHRQLREHGTRFSQKLGEHFDNCHALAGTDMEDDIQEDIKQDSKSRRPIIILAVGYGGLIYEQALAISLSQKGKEPTGTSFDIFAERYQLAFLLGTPHFPAGLGEWAIMCARRLQIPCAKRASEEKWSDDVKESVAIIKQFQNRIRDMLSNVSHEQTKTPPIVKIVGCSAFETDPVTKLRVTPEWAALPGFIPLVIRADHCGITRSNPDIERIFTMVRTWSTNMKVNVPSIIGGVRRYALLVGVDHYVEGHPGRQRKSKDGTPTRLRDLGGCANDIELADDVLERYFDFHEKVLLISSRGEDQTNNKPTFRTIKEAFHRLSRKACKGDVFYFHFSGRGALLYPPTPTATRFIQEKFIFPMDYCLGEPAIRVSELLGCLQELRSKEVHVFAFFDTSYIDYNTRYSKPVNKSAARAAYFNSIPCNGLNDSTTFQEQGEHQDHYISTSEENVRLLEIPYLLGCDQLGTALECTRDDRVFGRSTFEFYTCIHEIWNMGETKAYKALYLHLEKRLSTVEHMTQQPFLSFYGHRTKDMFLGVKEKRPGPVSVLKVVGRIATLYAGNLHGVKVGTIFKSLQIKPPITFTVEGVHTFTSTARVNGVFGESKRDTLSPRETTCSLEYLPQRLAQKPETFVIDRSSGSWPSQYALLRVMLLKEVADDDLQVFVDSQNENVILESVLWESLAKRVSGNIKGVPISVQDWENLHPRSGVMVKYIDQDGGAIELDGLDSFFKEGKSIRYLRFNHGHFQDAPDHLGYILNFSRIYRNLMEGSLSIAQPFHVELGEEGSITIDNRSGKRLYCTILLFAYNFNMVHLRSYGRDQGHERGTNMMVLNPGKTAIPRPRPYHDLSSFFNKNWGHGEAGLPESYLFVCRFLITMESGVYFEIPDGLGMHSLLEMTSKSEVTYWLKDINIVFYPKDKMIPWSAEGVLRHGNVYSGIGPDEGANYK
ncbi:caspase domain-containing protein [Apiospora marii]|uniref:caspase domain-containing protein n=1 Tax=Apiospora marii TaxID=335849 RepID=UPI00312E855E